MSSPSIEAIHSDEKLFCPACMTTGTVTWEDTPPAVPHARARNRLRKLTSLTAGFKSTDNGEREGPVITCSGCGGRIAPL
jgi:hypothetical protein